MSKYTKPKFKEKRLTVSDPKALKDYWKTGEKPVDAPKRGQKQEDFDPLAGKGEADTVIGGRTEVHRKASGCTCRDFYASKFVPSVFLCAKCYPPGLTAIEMMRSRFDKQIEARSQSVFARWTTAWITGQTTLSFKEWNSQHGQQ